MKKRKLGKTGMNVSEVAFGGVEIGMPYGIGVKNKSDMLSEKDAVHLLHAAMDSGINFFDTARLYGTSENIMGKAFKDRRLEAIINTKCVHLRDTNGNLPNGKQLKKAIETSLKESLKALQTDYVDIFMVHNADIEILENESISRIFADLKKAGVARAIGVSTYLPEETQMVLETGMWDVIQLPFNLMDQRQKDFFDLALQNGIGLVVRSVLLKGLLSDKGTSLHPALINVENHIKSYQKLMKGPIRDLATLATKFVLSFEEVSSVLIGIDRMDYLRKSIETADGRYLEGNELLLAEKLSYPDPAFLNLPHWDKMGWLK